MTLLPSPHLSSEVAETIATRAWKRAASVLFTFARTALASAYRHPESRGNVPCRTVSPSGNLQRSLLGTTQHPLTYVDGVSGGGLLLWCSFGRSGTVVGHLFLICSSFEGQMLDNKRNKCQRRSEGRAKQQASGMPPAGVAGLDCPGTEVVG